MRRKKLEVPTYGKEAALALRSASWAIWLNRLPLPPKLRGYGFEDMFGSDIDKLSEALNEIAYAIETAPGPIAIRLTETDNGVPIAIAREVLLVMRAVLA